VGVVENIREDLLKPSDFDHDGLGISFFRGILWYGSKETTGKPANRDQRVFNLVSNGIGEFSQGYHLFSMDEKVLSLFEFLMNLFQISIENRVLNNQTRLIGEQAEKVNVLFCNRVLVVKVIHHNDTDDLSLPNQGHRSKRIDPWISAEMIPYITSYLRTQMTTSFASGL